MKRIRIILSVSILLVVLSGCGNQKVQNNDDQTNNNTNVSTTDKGDNTTKTTDDVKEKSSDNTKKDNTNANSDKTEKNTNTNNSSQNTTKEINNDQNKNLFYGNWEIKKVAGYAKVSTGEKKSLIGIKLSLSNDLATLGNESYNNPQYKITNKTRDNMASDYKTDLSKIGVDADSITELDVPDKMTLFIKDNNTLLYFDEGVYYETQRVS